MKTIYCKPILALCLCMIFSCNHDGEMPNQPTASTIDAEEYLTNFNSHNAILYDEVEETVTDAFAKARLHGSDYLQIDSNGDYFIDLDDLIETDLTIDFGGADLVYFERAPNGRTLGNSFDFDEVSREVDDIGYSPQFKTFLEDLLAVTVMINTHEYGVVEKEMNNLVNSIDQRGFDELEIQAVSLISELSLSTITSVYLADQLSLANGRSCETNWRKVARSAIEGGIALGAVTGWEGIKRGAIAGLAGGNPVVGGIVGGLAGFAAGFIGGAIIGGVGSYIAHKATCSGKTTQGRPVIFNGSSYSVCLDKFCRKRRPIITPHSGMIYF